MPKKVKPPEGLLARRLDFLFRTVVNPVTGEPYQHKEAAEAINQAAGEDVISGTYIWQLRTGARDNPTKKHMAALAALFGVSPVYFFDDDADASRQAQADAEATAAWRDDGVRSTALRAAGLSEPALRTIQQMIDNLRAMEGLPGSDPPADAGPG